MQKISRSWLVITFVAIAGFASVARAAQAPVLEINVDHGITLNLATPASSVFIASPEIADVQVLSPTSIMVFGKRAGETTFVASDSSGRSLVERTIHVSQDLSALRRELDTAIPGNKIKAESVPNGIVLTGEAKDAAAVADAYKITQRFLPGQGGDIINRVYVAGSNQIQLRVRFAEVARNIDNSLGFNWQNLGTFGDFAFGIATGTTLSGTGTNILSTRPNNTSLTLPNDVIGLAGSGSHFNVNALIDALAQDGLITILAEPNLTAMSGETANFLAGGEFPIPIPQGNGAISIQFKPYGISLAFTPTLIGENRINIHVRPEVSQLTTTGSIILQNITVPALTTRKAETTVEVASGQSFAIAGLLDNNQAQTVNKYPFLGDLPVLGALFRDSRFQNDQTELVIIITPYIVRPSGEQLALPTDGFIPPTEAERMIELRQSSANTNARAMSGQPTGVQIDTTKLATQPMTLPPTSLASPNSNNAAAANTKSANKPDLSLSTMTNSAEPPTPTASPTTPVAKAPSIISPAPAHDGPTNLVPTGPSGFMLE